MYDKINKYFSKIKRDGFINATKKAFIMFRSHYLKAFNFKINREFKKNRDNIKKQLDKIFNTNNYDRVIIWRSSVGWNIPLFQRPQHLCNNLADKKCLVLYEVTKLTDDVDFIKKQKDNLYLINYECEGFEKLLEEYYIKINKPKYIFLASTCWDISIESIKKFIKSGFRILYDYLDHLSAELSSTNKLPKNVIDIHNYVIKNPEKSLVVCTADILYEDMIKKRKSDYNVVFACNGVTYEHFSNLKNKSKFKFSKDFEKVINQNKPIIGYYGALAKWFDYDMIKYLAINRKEYNIVLIGAKYDTSFDDSKIIEIDNIFYISPKSFDELPYYADRFNVCVLPFLINDITKATSPIKIFEYMALSKPIVTTDLKECRKYKSIKIANNNEEFVNLCDKMIDIKDEKYFKQLKKDALNNTWESKALIIIENLVKLEKNS